VVTRDLTFPALSPPTQSSLPPPPPTPSMTTSALTAPSATVRVPSLNLYLLILWCAKRNITEIKNAYSSLLPSFLSSLPKLRTHTVRIVTPPREDRPPYAFVEFESVKSALAAMDEMEFRVSVS